MHLTKVNTTYSVKSIWKTIHIRSKNLKTASPMRPVVENISIGSDGRMDLFVRDVLLARHGTSTTLFTNAVTAGGNSL